MKLDIAKNKQNISEEAMPEEAVIAVTDAVKPDADSQVDASGDEVAASEDAESKKAAKGKKNKKSKGSGKKKVQDEKNELLKLKKRELLEIMLKQGEEIDALRNRVAELEAQLNKREFDLQKVGSIAQASLQVTNIFEEAEKAAKIYLENIRRQYVKRTSGEE